MAAAADTAPRLGEAHSADSAPRLGPTRTAETVGATLTRQASALGITLPGAMSTHDLEAPAEELFDCCICFMSKPLTARFDPFPECEHDADSEICQSCFEEAVEYDINNGKVTPGVACPVADCSHVLTDEEVERVVSAEVMGKYRRFKANAGDATMRECGKCGHNQPGNPSAPIMTCGKCGNKYCYFHATAHEPTEAACREYHRKHRAEAKQNIALLNKTAGSCPSCSAVTEKNQGCNHMTCRCGTHWCWLCGQDITGAVGYHYSPGNVLGCPGLMMQHGPVNSRREHVQKMMKQQGTCWWRLILMRRGFMTLLWLPFALLFLSLFAAVGLIVWAVALIPFVLCVLPSVHRSSEAREIAFRYILVTILMGPAIAAAMLFVTFQALYAFVLLVICGRLPPPPRNAMAEDAPPGMAGRLGVGRFGAVGGDAVRRDEAALAAMGSAGSAVAHDGDDDDDDARSGGGRYGTSGATAPYIPPASASTAASSSSSSSAAASAASGKAQPKSDLTSSQV